MLLRGKTPEELLVWQQRLGGVNQKNLGKTGVAACCTINLKIETDGGSLHIHKSSRWHKEGFTFVLNPTESRKSETKAEFLVTERTSPFLWRTKRVSEAYTLRGLAYICRRLSGGYPLRSFCQTHTDPLLEWNTVCWNQNPLRARTLGTHDYIYMTQMRTRRAALCLCSPPPCRLPWNNSFVHLRERKASTRKNGIWKNSDFSLQGLLVGSTVWMKSGFSHF